FAQPGGEVLPGLLAAELRADRARVDPVVAVRRSGGGGEQRGGVERADAEPVQVAGEGAGIAQPASRAQLQPVGRRRGRGRAFAAGRLAHPTTVLPAARPALTPPAAPPPGGRAAVPRSSPPARNGPGAAGGPGRAADG